MDTDTMAMELAFTFYTLRNAGVSNKVLDEIRSLAYRTIGKAAFQAALEVVPKF